MTQPITRTPYTYNLAEHRFEIALSNGDVVSHPDSIACVVKAAEARMHALNAALAQTRAMVAKLEALRDSDEPVPAMTADEIALIESPEFHALITAKIAELDARTAATTPEPEPTPPAISAPAPKKSRRATRVRRPFDGPMSAGDVLAAFRAEVHEGNARLKAAA